MAGHPEFQERRDILRSLGEGGQAIRSSKSEGVSSEALAKEDCTV